MDMPKKMKTVVLIGPNILEVQEVETPAPGSQDVLINVQVTHRITDGCGDAQAHGQGFSHGAPLLCLDCPSDFRCEVKIFLLTNTEILLTNTEKIIYAYPVLYESFSE
jgi:hypothetical protein